MATLIKVLADDEIAVTQIEREVASDPSKLNEEIVGAIEKLSHEFWPDAAVIPAWASAARIARIIPSPSGWGEVT